MAEIFDSLRDELEEAVPELSTEFVPLVQDQINDLAGVDRPIEVKVFGPDVAKLRRLATKVAAIVESVPGAADVNANVRMGNPDIVVRPNSVETERVGLTEQDVENQLNAALYGQVASTVPEEDRMTNIRVRYPDRVRFDRQHLGEMPISLPGQSNCWTERWRTQCSDGFVVGRSAGIRAVRAAGHDRGRAAPTNCGAKISSR